MRVLLRFPLNLSRISMLEAFLFTVLAIASPFRSAGAQEADGPQLELDMALHKARLASIFGEKRHLDRSVWEVSIDGSSQKWRWNGKGFKGCESSEELSCTDWIPLSFRWWLAPNNWLSGWVEFERKGFYFGAPREKPRQLRPHSVLGAFLAEEIAKENNEKALELLAEQSSSDESADDESEMEEVLLSGKRLASEMWEWKRANGERVRIYSSLRNQWIERIDWDGVTEYIEWVPGPRRWSRPVLNRLIMERDGKRVTFTRVKK